MRGAIAAGHPLTAEAGARVLREGGNAGDAAGAADPGSWVFEGTLTRPRAGGFMLLHPPPGPSPPGVAILVQTALAGTLELLAERGARTLYGGELARAIVDHVGGTGGCITARDLKEYRVIRRRPVATEFRGHEYLSNPPPSAGGILIAYGLGLLQDLGGPGSAEAIDALARGMREQMRARENGFDRALPPGRPARLLGGRAVVIRG